MAFRALRPGLLTVLAVFARSIYARSAGGDILCLCGAELPLGPFTLVCEPWPLLARSAAPGDIWTLEGDMLVISRHTRIAPGDASLWEPERTPGRNAAACENALARIRDAYDRSWEAKGGLAALLPWLLGAADAPVSAGGPAERALLKAGRRGVRALDAWLHATPERKFSAARQRVPELLLGLGPGLTPSGDDVLGGALLALHGLGCAEPAGSLGESILSSAGERTNPISLAYLRAAAAGYGASVLHEAVAAVCADSPSLFESLRRLDRMGHSSGRDAFLGVVCVCRRARLLPS
jgi:hypothetical protein